MTSNEKNACQIDSILSIICQVGCALFVWVCCIDWCQIGGRFDRGRGDEAVHRVDGQCGFAFGETVGQSIVRRPTKRPFGDRHLGE